MASLTNLASLPTTAPILPNEGLGGIRLRSPMAELQDLIGHTHWMTAARDNTWFRLTMPFEASYRLGPIEIGVDVRNGKIFKLIAHEGYRGTLFGSIRVGMTVRDAMSLDPRLRYSEEEEVILVDGVPGVCLDIPEIDPPPELVPSYRIDAISVYADEVFNTRAGMRGNW